MSMSPVEWRAHYAITDISGAKGLLSVVASVLTAQTTGNGLQPWMSQVIADACGSQAMLDGARSMLSDVPGSAPVLAEAIITETIKQLLAMDNTWSTASAHKPSLKKVTRLLVEGNAIRIMAAEHGGPTSPNETLRVFWWSCKAPVPAKIPFVVWESPMGMPATDSMWASLHYTTHLKDWFKPVAEAGPPALTTDEAVATTAPAKKVDKAANVAALMTAITSMVKEQVTAQLTTTLTEDKLTKTVVDAATKYPMLWSKATTAYLNANGPVVQQNIKNAVDESLKSIDLVQMVQAVAEAKASQALDLSKIKSEIAEKLATNSDEYFAMVFDRIAVVLEPETAQQLKDGIAIKAGSIIGRLVIKEAFQVKPPVLPKVKSITDIAPESL